MKRILIKRSILNIDGKYIPVDTTDWANLRLSGQELTEFLELQQQLVALLESNNVTFTQVSETIDGLAVPIGLELLVPENETYSSTELYDRFVNYWIMNRMKTDPAIIVFNWEENLGTV